jgi:hypothetical protein
MIAVFKNDFIDFGFELLNQTLSSLEPKYREIDKDCESCADPDSFGLFDQMEYILGFSSVAYQTYINDTKSCTGISDKQAFKFGPRTKSNCLKIKLINQTANLWKHKMEWEFRNNIKHKESADKLLHTIGIKTDDPYPICGIYWELTTTSKIGPMSFIPLIEEWRSDLLAQREPQQDVQENGSH